MIGLLAISSVIATVFGEAELDTKELNKLFSGTYAFEILGRAHKLYLCDSDNNKELYWAVADVHKNEYTVGMHTIIFYISDIRFDHIYFI